MMKRKILIILMSFALFVSCLISCFIPTIKTANAINIEIAGGYTNVLEDLQKDENFNADDYPIVKDDYSLQVIQIAESSDKELFVYVYQPSAEYENLIATSINISTGKGLELSFKNYTLDLINSQGCFYKYRINDFIVSSDSIRYYEITSIYRAFNDKYDESIKDENGNIINEVPFKVAKHYTFTTTENSIELIVNDIEVIEITDKYVGFVRYFGGNSYVFCLDSCDSHFVAFSTDRQIDELLEADVFFQTQNVDYENGLTGGDKWYFYDIKDNYSYITEYDTAFYESPSSAWQGYSYSWSRIQTTDEFLKSNEFNMIYKGTIFNEKLEYTIDENMENSIRDMQWVLRFYESSYEKTNAPYPTKRYTIVSNVSILRLKFKTNSVVYN